MNRRFSFDRLAGTIGVKRNSKSLDAALKRALVITKHRKIRMAILNINVSKGNPCLE
jgi:hypothetical protein